MAFESRLPTITLALFLPSLLACTGPASQEPKSPEPQPRVAPPLASGVVPDHFDPNVEAAADFYRHVNGKWLDTATLPPDESDHGTFAEVADDAEARVRELVEQSSREPGSSAEARKIGDFYASFMDEATLEARGIDPLRPLLERVRELETRPELWRACGELSRVGVRGPVGTFVSPDRKDSSRYALYVFQSGLGLPDRSYYLEDGGRKRELRARYEEHVERMFSLVEHPDPGAAARRVSAFEKALAEAQWTRVASMDSTRTYNPMTPAELRELAPEVDFDGFFAGAELPQRGVVLMQPSYFQSLSRIAGETPLETLRDHLEWQLVRAHAPVMQSALSEEHFAFEGRALRGNEENAPRWKRGVEAVRRALGEAVGKLYVERWFGAESRERMLRLVEHLESAFAERLMALAWMSESTRAEALAKLAAMRVKIGHPERFRDYSELVVRRGELLENTQRALAFEHARKARQLSGPVDPDEWLLPPQTVNAYYSATRNEIVFPAAILTPPFFDVRADDAVNYGAIGAVIGHEISHGFDDQGRKSDARGNLRDWWTPADAEEFRRRSDELVEQFSRYEPLAGQRVDGELTLGENIADIAGVRVAHAAYRRSLGTREPPVIDGYGGDQRFFLGWAQIWRRKYRTEELERRLKVDSHAPSEYRVNGVLPHFDAFHAAFGTHPDSGMWRAPENRSTIW